MMTKKLLEEMQKYAKANKVPIVEQESVQWLETFLCGNTVDNVLEIGGAIAYSTILFQTLTNASVLSIEKDETRFNKAQEFLSLYEKKDKIIFINDDAKSEAFFDLVVQNGPYDFIFIDATKRNNQYFFEKFAPYVKLGGYIVTDNLDFHGLAQADEAAIKKLHRRIRPMIRAIVEYRQWLPTLENFETDFISIGDTLAISRKIKE